MEQHSPAYRSGELNVIPTSSPQLTPPPARFRSTLTTIVGHALGGGCGNYAFVSLLYQGICHFLYQSKIKRVLRFLLSGPLSVRKKHTQRRSGISGDTPEKELGGLPFPPILPPFPLLPLLNINTSPHREYSHTHTHRFQKMHVHGKLVIGWAGVNPPLVIGWDYWIRYFVLPGCNFFLFNDCLIYPVAEFIVLLLPSD